MAASSRSDSPGSGIRWHRLVGCDPRSLAALRIGLSSILIYDLLSRARDLEAHYADSGLLPRADLLAWKADAYNFSIHLLSGIWWVQGLLIGLALVVAVFLLVGRYTRTATFVSWLLLASIHARNPLILHGGDMLLRLMLFWSLFVPLGRAASLDALLSGRPPSRKLVVSVGTLALKLQLCGMYWTSAALKWHPIWIDDGTAVHMALKLDQLATPFGRWLTQWPAMLEFATHGTMVLETVGPVLVFVPVCTAAFQLFAVVLFAGFHLFGLAPALYLGIFPFICAASWSLFLPGRFWDRWRHVLPWQQKIESYGRSLGRLLLRLSGEREGPRTGARPVQPSPLRRATNLVPNVVAAVLIVYVCLWNLRTIDFPRYEQVLPRSANTLGNFLQVGQLWNLFAPFPATEDGWFVFEGTRVGGDTVEVRTGGEVSFEKPHNVSRSLGSERWKKYLMNLDDPQNGIHRRLYGKYLCRTWNARHAGDERLASIRMIVLREQTLPTGEEKEPLRGMLWNQICVLEDA